MPPTFVKALLSSHPLNTHLSQLTPRVNLLPDIFTCFWDSRQISIKWKLNLIDHLQRIVGRNHDLHFLSTLVHAHRPLAICLFDSMHPLQTWGWMAVHFHREPKSRGAHSPTSAAHSLNPSNDRPITQRLTPPLHPLPFEVWSLPLVTLSGRYCGLGTALQVSHYPPPHLSLYRRPCAPWSARAAHRPDTSPATDGSNSEIGLMLKTCSRPGAEKSGESVEEISTPGNLSRISRNPGKSETYRITDRPLKKAEAMGQGGYGRARRSPSKLSAERRPGHFYAHQLFCYCPRAALHCTAALTPNTLSLAGLD